MNAIDNLYAEYLEETGDAPPVRPKRLYVRRFPAKYTAAGLAWIAACNERQGRFLDWMLKRAKQPQFSDVT